MIDSNRQKAAVNSWDDLKWEDKQAALDSPLMASMFFEAKSEEMEKRDIILNRYKVSILCPNCQNNVDENYIKGIDLFCTKCLRKRKNAIMTESKAAEWILQHYYFLTVFDNGKKTYVYVEEKGIWDDSIAEAVISKESKILFGNDMNIAKLNNTILNIKTMTFATKFKFNSASTTINDKIYINLLNGVLDLTEKKLIPHNTKFAFLNNINVNYNKDAPIPEKIMKFLDDITTPNIKNFINLIEAFAYPLLPGYPIQQAITLVGGGGNGKTTYLNVLGEFYDRKNKSSVTLQQLGKASEGGSPFVITRLEGKLLNIADDLPNTPIKDLGFFKVLTGGSEIEGEHKYGSTESFINYAKFYFSANQMPVINENSIAFYRRFMFVELKNIIKNPEDQSKIIEELTTDEQKSGLLNMLINIVIPKLIKNQKFTFGDDIKETEKIYMIHSNTSELFCTKKLIDNSVSEIKKSELFESYQDYCFDNEYVEESQKKFFIVLRKIYPKMEERKITSNGIKIRTLIGIERKTDTSANIDEMSNTSANIDEMIENTAKILKDYWNNADFTTFSDISLTCYTLNKYISLLNNKGKSRKYRKTWSISEITLDNSNWISNNPNFNGYFNKYQNEIIINQQLLFSNLNIWILKPPKKSKSEISKEVLDFINSIPEVGVILGSGFEYMQPEMKQSMLQAERLGIIFEFKPGYYKKVDFSQ